MLRRGWFLIVDDEPLVQSSFGRILQIRECRTASSDEEALRRFEHLDGCIGVLLDENLGPESNPGHLLARVLRLRGCDLPIALVTGLAPHGLHAIAAEVSAMCMEKPPRDSEMRAWLCAALVRERVPALTKGRSRVRTVVCELADAAGLSLRQTDVLMSAVLDETRRDYQRRIGIRGSTHKTHADRISLKDGRALSDLAREARWRLFQS